MMLNVQIKEFKEKWEPCTKKTKYEECVTNGKLIGIVVYESSEYFTIDLMLV